MRRVLQVCFLSGVIVVSLGAVSYATPTETATDVVTLCQNAQLPGNTLTSAQKTWAQSCVKVFNEGKRLTPTSTPTPTATVSPTPSPTVSPTQPSPPPPPPPPVTGFPNATNTGVPAGTSLTTYAGCNGDISVITTPNTVIDSKQINCTLEIQTTGVQITKSKIVGQIHTNEETVYSFTLTDSEVDAGNVDGSAVGTTNMTILRANIHGGANIYCFAVCDVRESYLHGQQIPPTHLDAHLGGILMNDNGAPFGSDSGSTNATWIHNTIVCDIQPNGSDGGCSGDVNMFGDFGPVRDVIINGNYLGANSTGISYCINGGAIPGRKPVDHINISSNVFGRGSNNKCGSFGPVTAFDVNATGNVWSNNTWEDDGSPVPASL